MTVSINIYTWSDYSDTFTRCLRNLMGISPLDLQDSNLTLVAVPDWISRFDAYRNIVWSWYSYVGSAVEVILRTALRMLLFRQCRHSKLC